MKLSISYNLIEILFYYLLTTKKEEKIARLLALL